MSTTDDQLANMQAALETRGGVKKYKADDVDVESDDLAALTAREDILLARRNRATRGGMATRMNFSGGITNVDNQA
jgi:hypothetical protein